MAQNSRVMLEKVFRPYLIGPRADATPKVLFIDLGFYVPREPDPPGDLRIPSEASGGLLWPACGAWGPAKACRRRTEACRGLPPKRWGPHAVIFIGSGGRLGFSKSRKGFSSSNVGSGKGLSSRGSAEAAAMLAAARNLLVV